MAEITLTEEQTRIVAAAEQTVQVRDPEGNVIAFLVLPPTWTEAELQAIDQKWQQTQFSDCITTAELMQRLHALGEP